MGQSGLGLGVLSVVYLHPPAHRVRVKPRLAGECLTGEEGCVSGGLLAFKCMTDAVCHHLLHSYDAKGLKLALEECVCVMLQM